MTAPRFSVFVNENERFQPIFGWGHDFPGHLLVTDCSRWTDQNEKTHPAPSKAQPPPQWEWSGRWKVDTLREGSDRDGWSYAVTFVEMRLLAEKGKSRASPGLFDFVRRRRWVRHCVPKAPALPLLDPGSDSPIVTPEELPQGETPKTPPLVAAPYPRSLAALRERSTFSSADLSEFSEGDDEKDGLSQSMLTPPASPASASRSRSPPATRAASSSPSPAAGGSSGGRGRGVAQALATVAAVASAVPPTALPASTFPLLPASSPLVPSHAAARPRHTAAAAAAASGRALPRSTGALPRRHRQLFFAASSAAAASASAPSPLTEPSPPTSAPAVVAATARSSGSSTPAFFPFPAESEEAVAAAAATSPPPTVVSPSTSPPTTTPDAATAAASVPVPAAAGNGSGGGDVDDDGYVEPDVTMRRGEEGQCAFSEPCASTFKVRGATYLRDRRKQPSRPSRASLEAVEFYRCALPVFHAASVRPRSFLRRARQCGDGRTYYVVHIVGPAGNSGSRGGKAGGKKKKGRAEGKREGKSDGALGGDGSSGGAGGSAGGSGSGGGGRSSGSGTGSGRSDGLRLHLTMYYAFDERSEAEGAMGKAALLQCADSDSDSESESGCGSGGGSGESKVVAQPRSSSGASSGSGCRSLSSSSSGTGQRRPLLTYSEVHATAPPSLWGRSAAAATAGDDDSSASGSGDGSSGSGSGSGNGGGPPSEFLRDDPAFMRLWRRQSAAGPQHDPFRNQRFKLIPRLVVGATWLIRQGVGTKPSMLARKLPFTFHASAAGAPRLAGCGRYTEADMDIGGSRVATSLSDLLEAAAAGLVIDLAFLVQGESDAELPERVIGCVRLHRPVVACAPVVPVPPSLRRQRKQQQQQQKQTR